MNNKSKRLSKSNKQEYVRLPKNQQGKSIPDINIYKNYNNYYSGDNLNSLEDISQKRNSLTDLDLITNTEIDEDIFSNRSSLSSSRLSPLSPLSIPSNNI